jgi:magnesium Mg(2+) and cobalt Co(2+) transport protein (corA)
MSINFPTISFDRERVIESETVGDDFFRGGGAPVRWADVKSLADSDGIRRLCLGLNIHSLIIEDILSPRQMTKMDCYDDCLFLVLKMLRYPAGGQGLETEHVSILLKDGCVASFQENGEDIFAPVRDGIREGRGGVRRFGADYLCYALIDTVVDNYFGIIDRLGDETDALEEEIINRPEKDTLKRIYFVKRELMLLRKAIFPLRELIGSLTGTAGPLIGEDVRIYLHDVYDHLIQIVDSVETYQDILSNMLDTYLSSVSNKTNDTMKILTIISTIFIPITFLAGIYGMNFDVMPELRFKYGYLLFWVISLVIAGCMILYFHRKKWF